MNIFPGRISVMLGTALAAVMAAQVIGAVAMRPTPLPPRRVRKGLPSLRAEDKNEIVRENKDLRKKLEEMTKDRNRLSENELAAIQLQNEYLAEKNKFKSRYEELVREHKNLKKDLVRAEVRNDIKD